MKRFSVVLFSVLIAGVASAQIWQVGGATVFIQGFVSADNSCYDLDACAIPTPSTGTSNAGSYVAGAMLCDYGVLRSRRVSEDQAPGFCCGNRTWAHSSCFAFSTIDGENTDLITIRYGTDVYNQAGLDCFYACQSVDSITFAVILDIAGGPIGTPVTVDYSWDHFGGIGGAHDAVSEDSCKAIGLLNVDARGEVFQNRFDFQNASAPGGMWGWNRKQNQADTLERQIGNQIVITGAFRVEANTNVPPPLGNPQTLDDQSATQWGQIQLSLGTPIVPTPPDSLHASWLEFSVDIGGDAEMSDPTIDGNEVFDPGDCYMSSTVPLPPGGLDGIVSDEAYFGYDPWPGAPDGPPPVTGAPVGSGQPIDSIRFDFYDLDGEDNIDIDLQQYDFGPGLPPIDYFPSSCIHPAEYLYVSFDDDTAPFYSDAGGSAPVSSPSPTIFTIYGTTPVPNEVVGLSVFAPWIPAIVYFQYPYLDEVGLHVSLRPNPLPGDNAEDDDADALDIRDDDCSVFYFTMDHEATRGFDPGIIYQDLALGFTPAIIDSVHLGLPWSTDIDAFEFAGIPDMDGAGNVYLGLLFSVDDDDPATPEDESGGLDPAMIYASYLTGYYFPFLEAALEEDVDAIAAWETPLYTGYVIPTPCLPAENLVIVVDVPNQEVTLSFDAPQYAIYTIYEATSPNADPPPSADWTSVVDIPANAGDNVSYTMTYSPLPTYMNYTVIATCP